MVAMETFALVASVEAWVDRLRGGSWIIHCDNRATVEACSSMRAKRGDWTGRLLRRLWKLKIEHGFELEVRWIGTKLNREADLCSRSDGLPLLLRELADCGLAVPRQVRVKAGVRDFFAGRSE